MSALGSQIEAHDAGGPGYTLPRAAACAPSVTISSGARETGRRVRTSRSGMRRNGKAVEIRETAGLIRTAGGAGTHPHLFINPMNAGAPSQAIRDAVHINPAVAESVQSAVPALD